MGLNLPKKPKQSLWDKVKDTFDANTEADYYRRQVEMQKQGRQPYRQTYTQEQFAKGNQTPLTNPAMQIARTVGKPFWELGDLPVAAAKWGVGNVTGNQQAAANAKKNTFESRNQGFITGSVNNWINSTGNIGTRLATGDKFINTDSLRLKEDILPVVASGADIATYGLQATGVGSGTKVGLGGLLTRETAKNVTKQAAAQGVTGGIAGTYEPARTGQDWGNIAQAGLTSGAATAGAGVVLPAVGAVTKAAGVKLKSDVNNVGGIKNFVDVSKDDIFMRHLTTYKRYSRAIEKETNPKLQKDIIKGQKQALIAMQKRAKELNDKNGPTLGSGPLNAGMDAVNRAKAKNAQQQLDNIARGAPIEKTSEVDMLHRWDRTGGKPNIEALDAYSGDRGTGGLGTGIYFNIKKAPQRDPRWTGDPGVQSSVKNTLRNPLILRDVGETSASDVLNKAGQYMTALSSKSDNLIDGVDGLPQIEKFLKEAGIEWNPKLAIESIEKTRLELNGRTPGVSDKTLENVDQPITHYLKSLGYDGIINYSNDTTAAGSVIFRGTKAFDEAMAQLQLAPKPAATAPPKPKVTIKKTVETPPTTEKPNVVKSNEPVKPAVTKKKGFNDYIDDIAQSQGIDTTYNAPEMFAFNRGLNKVTGGRVKNLMQINPIRKGVQATEDALSAQAKKANVSRKGSKTLNTSRSVFAQAGISDADRMANRRFRDAQTLSGDLTKGEMRIADDMVSKLPDPEKSLDNVYRYVADDKILERTHGKGARLKLSDLSPEEQAIANRIVAIQKRTNEINYKIGKITEEQFKKESKKGHYARIFNIKEKGGKQLGKKPIDTKPFEKRKDPAEFSDEVMELLVKDPFRGALARQEIALRSLASHEFMGELVDQGRLLKNKPNNSFQQLNGKKYGKYDGMWADNTTRAQIKQNMEFESEWAKKYVGQLLDDYKASILGKTQRVLKATKTVLNPGTNVQNVMSNILFFNRGSGVGIIRNAIGMAQAAKDLAKARNGKLTAELIQAKKLGVFGSDSGKAMTGDIAARDLASIPGNKNVVMKGLEIAEDAYGGADNAAKLGLWRNLQKKGLSPEEAAKQVQKFTQDYHNVGRVIGAMADAPVLGKPFARFIPELIRLSKNNIAYNPAATVASLAALAYAGNALSEAAGETDEERANREGVIGNTNLPGTAAINKMLGGPDRDISLNFAVGDSSVNIARAIGLNFPTEPGQDPNRALLEQILPFEVPTRKDAQGNEVFDPTKIVTNLGLRPLIETKADRNFMGQSIKDPENKVRVEGSDLGKTYQGDIPVGEQRKNVINNLARAYLPMGNEIDSVVSAFKGEPNSMGKERTPGQALLRTVGIKVEKNDQAARDKRASTKEFFEGKVGQVNDFLNKNPDLKDTYLKVKSGTKDRATGKKVVDLVTPEKWQVIAGEKSGRLFEQLKTEDEYQNKQDPSYPVDPIFSNQLSKEQRNQILQIRASYSGDNIEQEEILRATKPWYQNFEAAERDRSAKLSEYFSKLKAEGKLSGDTQNERVKAYGELYDKYSPKQTPLMTKYYQLKESNPDAAKNLFKTNPELSDQFSAYKDQKLKYINEKRKIEGVPPIDRNTFLNVTFGYEDDERKVYNELKYGKGYGGYGSGGGSDPSLNPLKYALPLSAGGKFKAPVSSKPKAVKVGIKKKDTTAKPKVSIKKSLV